MAADSIFAGSTRSVRLGRRRSPRATGHFRSLQFHHREAGITPSHVENGYLSYWQRRSQ